MRRLSNETLRSQAEHHAGMRFLPLLSDTCGERPAELTSRTATFSGLGVPPRRCRSTPLPPAAPLRQWRKRRLEQMTDRGAGGRGASGPAQPRPTANRNSERLIGDGIADQLV